MTTAIFPNSANSYDASAWDGTDGAIVGFYTTGLTSGNTSVGQVAQGLSPDDVVKLTFPYLGTIKVGDTISVWTSFISDAPVYSTMALLPYDSVNTVATGNKLTQSANVGQLTFTLTQAFIDDLFDQGSGMWACRIVEDGGGPGWATLSETVAALTSTGSGSPGSSPGNAPQNYEYIKNKRLTSNSSLSRMPRDQREWSAFIHELNKWIKDETGTFDISSSDTAKFTGFSSDPTSSSIWWHRYGQFVHIEFNIGTGTSDTTGFTITGIPEVIRPRDDCTYPLFGLWDAGAAIVDRGSVKIGSDGVITFYTDHQDGAWTGGATVKGFEAGLGAKGLIYGLRNPVKQ